MLAGLRLMEPGLSCEESTDGRVLCTQLISGNKGYLISLMHFCCLQMIAQSLFSDIRHVLCSSPCISFKHCENGYEEGM